MDRRAIIEDLMENALFMRARLKELREIIEKQGFSEEYQNGHNQYGMKRSVEADVYMNMTKLYAGVIKQLTALLPDEGGEDALAAFNSEA